MGVWRVTIAPRSAADDARGRGVLTDLRQRGLGQVRGVRSATGYLLRGTLSREVVERLAAELLVDPVVESFVVTEGTSAIPSEVPSVEVQYQPGVMDAVAGSVLRAGRKLLSAWQAGGRSGPSHEEPRGRDDEGATRRGLHTEGRDSGAGGPLPYGRGSDPGGPLPYGRGSDRGGPLPYGRGSDGGGAGWRLEEVRTARRYEFDGVRDVGELEWIARKVLSNDCIETVYVEGFGRHDPRPAAFAAARVCSFEKRLIPIGGLDDEGLLKLSRNGHLFLSLAEMRAIQTYYQGLGREPTDVELETFAQTWSEHCVHKTLKSSMIYRGTGFGQPGDVEVRFDNLFKSTIVAATRRLNRPWCLSVFEDNAGIVAFDDEYAVAFKVETHNHPSAIEPYGGASTGVGGCIRDILGCGLGAKPVACTDVFCLAPPDWPEEALPQGVLHPRRVLGGVVSGVRDYGNRMGIPTVNGAIYFDPRYLTNPLVFCGCVGLIPRDRIRKAARPGDLIVLVGGRTGRDGIHGATFSSAELTDRHADEFSHAVQIGNALEEKKLADALLAARDHASGCLFHSVTDCGAGGLSSAVGEMAAELGAVVELDAVPLKYAGLRYDEIWISEAQERMVLAVGPERWEALAAVCSREEVEATVIGRFTSDGRLVLRYGGEVVGDLDLAFLHQGLPATERVAEWRGGVLDEAVEWARGYHAVADEGARKDSRTSDSRTSDSRTSDSRTSGSRTSGSRTSNALTGEVGSVADRLLGELSRPNAASKEWVIRQYDHEVQGGSVVKPLVGPGQGPSDAAVLRPRPGSDRGIVLGCGLCPRESDDDPYEMAISAVDEALRNVVCVGGDPGRTAILDNFCWGEVETPRALGGLVRACRGAHDAAVAYRLPFISGKDSLNNHFVQDPTEAMRLGMPQRLSIPGTLLISALSVIEDVRRCVTMDLKQPGSRLVLVSAAERFDPALACRVHRRVADWIRAGDVLAAHDVSDGGLACAVAEMCIAGELGASVEVAEIEGGGRLEQEWFGVRRCAYVLECAPGRRVEGTEVASLGTVTEAKVLRLVTNSAVVAQASVERLRSAWRGGWGGPGATDG